MTDNHDPPAHDDSSTPHLNRLDELNRRAAEAGDRARSLAEARAEHARALERLERDRIAAYANADDDTAKRLVKQTAAAEAKSKELGERVAGAELAARRAQQARDAYIAQHHGQLVAERTPQAEQAVRAIEKAIADLGRAMALWQHEAAVQRDLLRPVEGRNGREIPELPIQQAARELIRDLERKGIPTPLPHGSLTSPAPTSAAAAPVPYAVEVRTL